MLLFSLAVWLEGDDAPVSLGQLGCSCGHLKGRGQLWGCSGRFGLDAADSNLPGQVGHEGANVGEEITCTSF